MATLAVLIAVLSGGTARPARSTIAPAAADGFVTVTNKVPPVVQLRSLPHGDLTRTLLRSRTGTTVSAAQTGDSGVLVAASRGCTTTLERADPRTGRITVLRTIGETVADIAVSPDGRRLAYLTQPSCPTWHCKTVCAGPAGFLPNVLAVLDLRTGRSVRTATDTPGHPLLGLSWSPDGRRLVAGYMGNRWELVIFDRDHPDFHTAARVPNPPGCSYFAPSWTVAGLVAAQGCGSEPAVSPATLVRISPAGIVSARWRLPRCIDGLNTRTDPAHRRVLVQANIGHGSGRCGRSWATRIFQVGNRTLRPVLAMPGNSAPIQLEG